MKRTTAILISLLSLQLCASAQKKTTTFDQTWLAYLGQFRLSHQWAVNADASIRTKNGFVHDLFQGVVRAGLTRFLSENESVSAGYAFFQHYPGDNHPDVSQPEHRIWEQVQWNHNYQKLRLQQRLRLEERFRKNINADGSLGDGYAFNYRARFQLHLQAPLSRKGFGPHSLSLFLADEPMLNFGKQIVYNSFDQNRAQAGFQYAFDRNHNVQFGYMNVFQQQASGNKYKVSHVARIYYYQTFDLRKKKTV